MGTLGAADAGGDQSAGRGACAEASPAQVTSVATEPNQREFMIITPKVEGLRSGGKKRQQWHLAMLSADSLI